MIVQIILDRPHAHFTNLDVISGRVIVRSQSNTNVSSVIVKLEGESRTRLLAPPPQPGLGNDRPKPVLEVHKVRDDRWKDEAGHTGILYKLDIVWPAPKIQQANSTSKSFTLTAGQHEFPFQFKLPFNNACHTINSLTTNMNFAGLGVEIAKTPTRHVKATLPPSIYFPGEAEIRYYVKVTVNRPQFYKENPRAWANFNFLPIEPPRPEAPDGEAYARRQHQFVADSSKTSGRKRSLFEDMFSKGNATPEPTPGPPQPPRFSVDARLPNPSILTCGEDLPLRILVKQLSERNEPLYLQMLQVELIGYTKVRAHDVARTESTSWVVLTHSNLGIPIGSPADDVNTETEISKEFWRGHTLPNTVAPSFLTCNISRFYELEVRVGLGYGSSKHGKDQLHILPLRMPVKVYSGIAPPPALLEAMRSNILKPSKPTPVAPPFAGSPGYYTGIPQTPVELSSDSALFPPQQGSYLPAQTAPGYDDAPPSYEDAIAQDLPPVDAPRPDYAPPPAPEGEPRFSGNEKR